MNAPGLKLTAANSHRAAFAQEASGAASAVLNLPGAQTLFKGLKEGHSGHFRPVVPKPVSVLKAAV